MEREERTIRLVIRNGQYVKGTREMQALKERDWHIASAAINTTAPGLRVIDLLMVRERTSAA